MSFKVIQVPVKRKRNFDYKRKSTNNKIKERFNQIGAKDIKVDQHRRTQLNYAFIIFKLFQILRICRLLPVAVV